MVQQRRLLRVEVRLKALDTLEVGTGANALDVLQPIVANLGKRLAEIEPIKDSFRRGDRLRSQDQFGGGQDPRLREAADRALRLDVELSQRFELVAEKLGTDRAASAGRETIQDAPAHAELAAP